MSFIRAFDWFLAMGCVCLATAGSIFTFQQSYQVSSLLWSSAYIFAVCRLLLGERPR